MRGALVAGKDEVVGQRREQERHRQPRQDQALRPLSAYPRNEQQDDECREDAAGERRDRQRPDAETIAENGDDRNRARSGARGQPEQERIGKVVARHRLEQRADDAEAGTDADRQQGTRQAQIDDDLADRARNGLNGKADRVGERRHHVLERDDGGAVGDGQQGKGGDDRRPHDHRRSERSWPQGQNASGYIDLASFSIAAMLAGPGVSSS